MKLTLSILILLLICTACEKDELVVDEDTTHQLVPNTTIHYATTYYDSTATYVTFSREFSRDSFLLEARRYVDPLPQAVDDESTNVLTIPLARDIQSFTYTDEELVENGVFLNYEDCFCARFTPYPVIGTISGTQNSDGSWTVSGYVSPVEDFDGVNNWNVTGIYR